MLEIDGSLGEGGGQILRSALAIAAATGRPVRVVRIRAGRRRPGLMAQHLTVVRALAELTGAEVTGDRLGATTVTFVPRRPPAAGSWTFDVAAARPGGSAGSATLVLQSLHLPLARAEAASRLVVRGGTHVPESPPFEHLAAVYGPAVAELGAPLLVHLQRHGFHPAGGGEIHARIPPAPAIRPLEASRPSPLLRVVLRAAVAGRSLAAATRAVTHARAALGEVGAPVLVEVRRVASDGPGGYLYAAVERVRLPAGFVVLDDGRTAPERLAEAMAGAVRAHLASGAVADRHLADQLVLPLALAEGPSRFTAEAVTAHLRTQAELVERFGLARVRIDGAARPPRVEVIPTASASA